MKQGFSCPRLKIRLRRALSAMEDEFFEMLLVFLI
jgi:hypothetical protein